MRDRLLITVKTYPTLSSKYGELVCTAAVREDGSWVRLYPIPFRLLDYEKRYKKWAWIETTLRKSTRDIRPETYHPVDPHAIEVVGEVGTEDAWRKRRDIILGKRIVHTNLKRLIDGAHANSLSLAVFKPTRILRAVAKECERHWDMKQLEKLKANRNQRMLFEGQAWAEAFQHIRKLPCSFSYEFEDDSGRRSTMQVLDWEIGQLFWNCVKNSESEDEAVDKVKKKLTEDLLAKDLHFFLGTTEQFHLRAPNPWLIIGLFYPPRPPKNLQLDWLGDFF